jgi:hypothetical protein
LAADKLLYRTVGYRLFNRLSETYSLIFFGKFINFIIFLNM